MTSINIAGTQQMRRAISIAKYIDEKVSFLHRKIDRARKREKLETYSKKLRLYRGFQHRAFLLIIQLRSGQKFGDFSFLNVTAAEYKTREAERVQKGRDVFETKHKYSPHFARTGLHCDYGSFTCNACGRAFHHSPSTITKAGKTVLDCACGYCTNSIIGADWNEKPYQ